MRNPWVHDDVPDGAGSGYDGPVRLLAAFTWGSLALLVGGFVLLSGAGAVDLADGGSLGEVVTGVVAALALPPLLKLLAISRALALLGFLGATAAVGRFVLAGEPEQFRALIDARDGLAESADSLGGLSDFVDSMSPATVDGARRRRGDRGRRRPARVSAAGASSGRPIGPAAAFSSRSVGRES